MAPFIVIYQGLHAEVYSRKHKKYLPKPEHNVENLRNVIWYYENSSEELHVGIRVFTEGIRLKKKTHTNCDARYVPSFPHGADAVAQKHIVKYVWQEYIKPCHAYSTG